MKIKKEQTILQNDLYSIAGSVGLLVGNMMFNFLPGGNLIPIVMSSITGSFVLDDILSVKWNKMFSRCGLSNNEKSYPHHIKTEKTDKEIKYYFALPDGINILEFYAKQDLIESALNGKVKIEYVPNSLKQVVIKQYLTANVEYKWEKVFKNCSLRNKEGKLPELLEILETKIGNRYIFKMPDGLCFEFFEKYKPLFESSFHKPFKLELTKDYKLIIQTFDVKFKNRYKPKYDVSSVINPLYPLGIALTIDGDKEVLIDLEDAPNILVAGINGSGKSSLIRCLLTAMCLRGVELKIFDLKQSSDYLCFENYKNLTTFIYWGEDIVEKAEEEIRLLRRTIVERYAELRKARCTYVEYNKRFPENPMKPLVVVIEEFYIINDDKNAKKDLSILLAMGRACNIKFILCLQRPCQENLSSKIKANCNHIIGMMVNNTFNSGVVLGEGDKRLFTDLHGRGEAILLNNIQDIMFKSYYLSGKEVEKIIKPYTVKHRADDVVEDGRIIPMPPIPKQISVLEKSKVVNLEQEFEKNKVVDLL